MVFKNKAVLLISLFCVAVTSVTLHSVIKSIKYKALKLFWETGKNEKLPADQIKKMTQMLEIIDSAQLVPQDFEFFKSWRIHPLKGDLKGVWSLTVKEKLENFV